MDEIVNDYEKIRKHVRPRLDQDTLKRIGEQMRKEFVKQTDEHLSKNKTFDKILKYKLLRSEASLFNPEHDKDQIVNYGFQCNNEYFSKFSCYDDNGYQYICIKLEDFKNIVNYALEKKMIDTNEKHEKEYYDYIQEQEQEEQQQRKKQKIYNTTIEEFFDKKCSISNSIHSPKTDHRLFYLYYVYWMMSEKQCLQCYPFNTFTTYLLKYFQPLIIERVSIESRRQKNLIFVSNVIIDIPEIPQTFSRDFECNKNVSGMKLI